MEQNVCLFCGSFIDRIGEPCPFCGFSEAQAASPKLQPLLCAAFALLMESKFDKAKGALEAILKKDPENALAYFGRLRARYHISYIRTVGERSVPRAATRSAAFLDRDMDYGCAMLYAGEQTKAFLREQAEYLKGFCTRTDSGASKNITHQFTLGEVDPNDGMPGKLKNPSYTLKFAEDTDGTYLLTGIKTNAETGFKVAIPSVHKGKAVTGIGKQAFKGFAKLSGVLIPHGITKIGASAFLECRNLTEACIPESVTDIGDFAFSDCSGLKSISIPKGVTNMGRYMFWKCDSLENVDIPEGVKHIGEYDFYDCRRLTELRIPESVTSIGDHAFSYCKGLKTLTFPKALTAMGKYMFSYCTDLVRVTVPDGMTEVAPYAFYSCNRLEEITVPASVIAIGPYAFYDCAALKSISYGGTMAQWSEVTLGSGWNYLTGGYTVNCKDGTVSK